MMDLLSQTSVAIARMRVGRVGRADSGIVVDELTLCNGSEGVLSKISCRRIFGIGDGEGESMNLGSWSRIFINIRSKKVKTV